MSYPRVLPRDLFNEAKLLKCLGRLTLMHHESKKIQSALNVNHEDTRKGFVIYQDVSGEIYVSNLHWFDNSGTPIYLSTGLNSKKNYPLVALYKDQEFYVFDEEGNINESFIELVLEAL